MPKLPRRLLLGALALAFLALASCDFIGPSNNKGKIVGKWRGSVNLYGKQNFPVSMVMEFEKDGSFLIKGYGPTKTLKVTGKYRLNGGDYVTLFDLSEPIMGSTVHREKVTIEGDSLTMVDTDGTTMKFTRAN
jgi:uncharacterized protein (TIGR03066 family)